MAETLQIGSHVRIAVTAVNHENVDRLLPFQKRAVGLNKRPVWLRPVECRNVIHAVFYVHAGNVAAVFSDTQKQCRSGKALTNADFKDISSGY